MRKRAFVAALAALLAMGLGDGDVRVVATKGSSFETTIAVSPSDPANAVVGVMDAEKHSVDIYVTRDGGRTWSDAIAFPTKGSTGRDYDGQGDPVVVADRTGVFHFGILLNSNNRYTGVGATRSTDGGATWSDPVVLTEISPQASPREFDDKEWMAVDDTGGPYDGHVYLLWQRINFGFTPRQSRMMFARSTDRGATWSAPVFLSELSVSGQSMIDIGPGGEVYIAYFRAADGGHVLRVSNDGGATFGAPMPLPSLPWIGGTIPNTKSALFKAFPTLLCDRSSGAHRGTLHLVLASETTSVDGKRVGGAAIARSIDGGRTWTAPRMISTPTTGDAIFPSGAVDQKTGELVLTWMDRRDDPSNTLARLYATRSRDGGVTFDAPRPFSQAFSIDAPWIGDYYGVAGSAGNWMATFSPASGEMSAVRLQFDPPAPAKPRRRATRP